MKEEGNDDETNEEQSENENENTETEENDFVILDFVGKKGKDQFMQTSYHKRIWYAKRCYICLTYYDNCLDDQENFWLGIWLRTWCTSYCYKWNFIRIFIKKIAYNFS